jgi:hypothetical protein
VNDREKLQERLTKLVGGVAIIKLGAATETEMKDKKKARVEDAMHATKAAVEKTWSPGEAVVAVLADLRIDPIARTCLLGREGRPAATRRLGVRVLDGEAAAGDGVDEIDLGVLQILDADRVDEQLDAVGLEDLIARSLAVLLDHQAVLEARAPAALHEHAQAAAGLLFLDQQLTDLRRRRFRYVDHDPKYTHSK